MSRRYIIPKSLPTIMWRRWVISQILSSVIPRRVNNTLWIICRLTHYPWEMWLWFQMCIFKPLLVSDIVSISSKYCHLVNAQLMPHDLTVDKSTLVQVMAWCRQATSNYLSQCWHRSVSPYGVTRPQWVKHGIQWGGLTSCLLGRQNTAQGPGVSFAIAQYF